MERSLTSSDDTRAENTPAQNAGKASGQSSSSSVDKPKIPLHPELQIRAQTAPTHPPASNVPPKPPAAPPAQPPQQPQKPPQPQKPVQQAAPVTPPPAKTEQERKADEIAAKLGGAPKAEAAAPTPPAKEVAAPAAATKQPEQSPTPQPQSKQGDKPTGGGDGANTKKPMRIGERLMQMGLISPDQLMIALQEQKTSKKLLGGIMVDMGFITESALGEVLAETSGAEKFDPKSTMLDPNLVNMIPKDVASRHKVIPVSMENDTVYLAMADVYNVVALDQARRHFPRKSKVVPLFCTETEIIELIEQYYEYEMSIDGILKEIETGIRENNELSGEEDGYVNPTVRLVNSLLVDAIKSGASDIHFEPEGSFLRLRYRIDGAMTQVRSFHRSYWGAVVVRLKIMSGMNIAETRNPQDGRIGFKALGREVDFRVATQPTVHGENIVLRLLDKTKSLVPLEKLGFSEHTSRLLKKMVMRPEGIIIVTGPTGSGKTTTLYSVLNYINSMEVNIMTLEDPVEYQLPLIRQTNVREGSVDFHSGISSLMRQDPDIIFVGEVRDEETALMAVRAALTGHQVYTTLHTNDALGAIPRLGDIGVPAHLLAGSLICVMAQRLARRLCNACKKPKVASPEECRILGIDPDEPPTIYEEGGCSQCNQKGVKGRVAINEILPIDKGMDELISTHATRNVMMEYALEHGFVPMMLDGIDKVMLGTVSLKELIETIDLTERL